MRALVLGSLLAVSAAGCCRHAAAPPAGDPERAGPSAPPAGRVVPGEYLFTVTPGTTPQSLQSSLADLAPQRIQPAGENVFLVAFGSGDPGLSRLSFRIGNGQILAVQPNFVYRALSR